MPPPTPSGSSSPTPAAEPPARHAPAPIPSFFPTYALDQAFCGIGAGIISTLVMHPLDLVKVRFQVSTTSSISDAAVKGLKKPGTLEEIWGSLRDIGKHEGIRGLYRGLTPNLVGNASSWGLYFLWSVEPLGIVAVSAADRARDQVYDDQGEEGRRRPLGQARSWAAPARIGRVGYMRSDQEQRWKREANDYLFCRYHYGGHDKSIVGCKDAHVHVDARLARSLQKR